MPSVSIPATSISNIVLRCVWASGRRAYLPRLWVYWLYSSSGSRACSTALRSNISRIRVGCEHTTCVGLCWERIRAPLGLQRSGWQDGRAFSATGFKRVFGHLCPVCFWGPSMGRHGGRRLRQGATFCSNLHGSINSISRRKRHERLDDCVIELRSGTNCKGLTIVLILRRHWARISSCL